MESERKSSIQAVYQQLLDAIGNVQSDSVRADNDPFLDTPVYQAACLDRQWRALLNASRRLRSRLKRCDTSSLSAPALLLLPATLGLCQLSRQLSQCQSPLSPNLLRVGEIEGAYARHDPTPSRSAKDPGPRSSWIRRLQKSS